MRTKLAFIPSLQSDNLGTLLFVLLALLLLPLRQHRLWIPHLELHLVDHRSSAHRLVSHSFVQGKTEMRGEKTKISTRYRKTTIQPPTSLISYSTPSPDSRSIDRPNRFSSNCLPTGQLSPSPSPRPPFDPRASCPSS